MLNDEVAEALRAHAGRFVVWDRVETIGGRRLVDADGAELGDIDVLALDLDDATIHPLEVKDFAVGFTPRAFSSSVERLRAAIAKHGRRVAWVAANKAHVVATADGDPTRESRLEPTIVLDEEVAGAHLEDYEMS